MQNTAISYGRILVIIGLIGYAYGFFTGGASITALIPAAFGIAIMIMGYIARARGDLNKMMMHIIMVVALIGFLVPLIRLLSKISNFSINAASISMIAMSLTCLGLLVLGIKSFKAARAS